MSLTSLDLHRDATTSTLLCRVSWTHTQMVHWRSSRTQNTRELASKVDGMSKMRSLEVMVAGRSLFQQARRPTGHIAEVLTSDRNDAYKGI